LLHKGLTFTTFTVESLFEFGHLSLSELFSILISLGLSLCHKTPLLLKSLFLAEDSLFLFSLTSSSLFELSLASSIISVLVLISVIFDRLEASRVVSGSLEFHGFKLFLLLSQSLLSSFLISLQLSESGSLGILHLFAESLLLSKKLSTLFFHLTFHLKTALFVLLGELLTAELLFLGELGPLLIVLLLALESVGFFSCETSLSILLVFLFAESIGFLLLLTLLFSSQFSSKTSLRVSSIHQSKILLLLLKTASFLFLQSLLLRSKGCGIFIGLGLKTVFFSLATLSIELVTQLLLFLFSLEAKLLISFLLLALPLGFFFFVLKAVLFGYALQLFSLLFLLLQTSQSLSFLLLLKLLPLSLEFIQLGHLLPLLGFSELLFFLLSPKTLLLLSLLSLKSHTLSFLELLLTLGLLLLISHALFLDLALEVLFFGLLLFYYFHVVFLVVLVVH
jgi:hypothetical protein